MRDHPQHGITLLEIAVALALSAVVLALIGSLFVASLSAWRRGQDLREAQAEATLLVEVMARDIRSASQAPSITVRPQVPTDEGNPLFTITAAGPGAPESGQVWILYVHVPQRQHVLRQTLVPGPEGQVLPRDTRIVARGVEGVTVTHTGMGLTIEATVRRGRDVATSRSTAVPRNP